MLVLSVPGQALLADETDAFEDVCRLRAMPHRKPFRSANGSRT
jgi:hypothetical protein